MAMAQVRSEKNGNMEFNCDNNVIHFVSRSFLLVFFFFEIERAMSRSSQILRTNASLENFVVLLNLDEG